MNAEGLRMGSDALARIVFLPSGIRGTLCTGITVLEAARKLGVDVESICGGAASCGRCQIEVVSGKFSKHRIESSPAHISQPTAAELDYCRRRPLPEGRRLSCQAFIQGDAVIDVPGESQVHQPVLRKQETPTHSPANPSIQLLPVEIPCTPLENGACDVQRLHTALAQQWRVSGVQADLRSIRELQQSLRCGGSRLTVAIRDGRDLMAVWPGPIQRGLGVAVDVGSTTISAELCDLSSGRVLAQAGAINPQVRYGEDLMSRIAFANQNAGGAALMTGVVRNALNELIRRLADEVGVPTAEILEMTLVGNPVMHHLVLGLDPTPLGEAPFTLATNRGLLVAAAELGLAIHPQGRVFTLPCISGHVGADAAAVIWAESLDDDVDATLLIDVGTNAEVILAHEGRIIAASSPTGPAFEGAQISCGQRASAGAVERVRIDRRTLEPRFKIIGCDLWSDDPAFPSATRACRVTGICGSGIIEAVAEMYLSRIIDTNGVIDGSLAKSSRRIVGDGRAFHYVLHEGEPGLRITQLDVRAIQLAKAALYAGIQLLLEQLQLTSVSRIRLAGSFGSYIDVRYAMVLGMIPDCDLEHVSAAGNLAGRGARMALLDPGSRAALEARISRVERFEPALAPRFQEHFVDAMAIPHKKHSFPHLARVVPLPARSEQAPSRRRSRRLGGAT